MNATTARQSEIMTLALGAAVVALMQGCVSHREYEIDATGARDFEWEGRIRLVEETAENLGPFFTMDTRTYVSRIELVGTNGRSIAIQPSHLTGCTLPLATVRTHTKADQLLPALLRTAPMLDPLRNTDGTLPEPSPADSDAMNEVFASLGATTIGITERRFDEIDGIDVALLAAHDGEHVETTYQLQSGLRVRIIEKNRTTMTVVVEDQHGVPLHTYPPVELPIREIAPDE